MRVTSSLVLAALVATASADYQVIDFTVEVAAAIEQATVTMGTGDLLRINLPENPSAGYEWRYANPFEDMSSPYSVEMDTYVPYNSDSASELDGSPAGAGGTRSIQLKATRSGTKKFEVILVRSWEVEDFLETHTAKGEPITISQIPNFGYKSVTVNVNQ